MCGRFAMRATMEILRDEFGIDEVLIEPEVHYNIAPSQDIPVVTGGASRKLAAFRWGLIPSWARDPGMGAKMINARAETVATKPAYRAPFKRRRCLIPASGFFEWQRQGSRKIPHYISAADGRPLALAGVWDLWESPEAAVVSCAIITTTPNELMEPIHDRMPVILDRADYTLWLDPEVQRADELGPLLVPCPAERLVAHPVSDQVNKPDHDDPSVIEPISERQQKLF